MIQKYTSGWPKYQKSSRVTITSMPDVQPSDHGMSISISIVMPIVAMIHIANVVAAMKAGNGITLPGFARRKTPTFKKMSIATSHVPATSSVAPI